MKFCVFYLSCCPSCFALDSAVSPTEGASVPAKVSPPSYAAVAGPTSSHHHHHHHSVTSPVVSSPSSSYPAVLVGRTNSESKMKVPPPVPPRGTPKAKRGGALTTTTTTATGKGDNSFPLHDVFRYPLFMHDTLNKITCLVKGGSEIFYPATDVRLNYFRKIDDESGVNNNNCRVDVDDEVVV